MASSFDTNANNYTISELLIILDLDDPTSSEIIDATNKYIERFDSEGNAKMVKFFTDVQTKLVEYVDNL